MPRPKPTPGHRDVDALVFLRRLVDHVEADPPPGLDLALASRARSELARLLDQKVTP